MSGISISCGLAGGVVGAPIFVPPPPPSFELFSTLSGGISGDVAIDGGNVTVTVTAPAIFAGVYTTSRPLLSQGPVALLEPRLVDDGTPAAGETLTAEPGLWLYDLTFDVPNVQTAWQADAAGDGNFADIAGAGDQTYNLTNAEAGDQVRLVEIATQTGRPSRTAPSAPVTVAEIAPPAGPPTLVQAPLVSGDPIEATALVADTSDTWRYDDAPATVTERAYRLRVGGSIVGGPQSAPSLTIPNTTGSQPFAYEMRVTVAEGSGAQSDWTEIRSGIVQDALELSPTGDGEVVFNFATGLVEVTIVAPTLYAGTYMFNADDLATGPVNLVPPIIVDDGSPTEGETVTMTRGLWIYDAELPIDAVETRWQRDGADIANATGNSYTLTSADLGTDLNVVETVGQPTTGARSVASPGVSVPGGFEPPVFEDDFTAYATNDSIAAVSDDWQYEEQQGGSYFTAEGAGQARLGNLGTGAQGVVYAGAISDDQYAQATFAGIFGTPVQANFGVSVRQVSTDRIQFIYIERDNELLLVETGQSGQRVPHTLVPGDVLRLDVVGTTATAYLNGSPVMTATIQTITTGKPGIRGYFQNTGGAQFSNFACGEL
ncbi:hypothetical protein V8J82_23425 [Gymnodinialimonas sp. 2305UL16-5]|uniref:hypothetical protein n=1 Tax=Gymnodinialimonas mytili TaxID=3126503 RepID=UPI0030A92372